MPDRIAQLGAQDPPIRLGIRTCQLTERVRHDGGHPPDGCLVHTVGQYVEWVPVCPKTGCRLPAPRETMRQVSDLASPRLRI